ncbi:MAG: UPF0104 family protein [Candidatus Dadabacteria bacterium]|nr:MAG: UPF0104 family protein [Candidatus Dadabacteria bacterium]
MAEIQFLTGQLLKLEYYTRGLSDLKIGKFIKNLFAIVLLVALVYTARPASLIDALKNLTFEAILYLLILSVVLIYVSALKWKLFLEEFGSSLPVLHLFNLYLVGYFVNLILPSYLGGDAVRSWYAGKKTDQHHALAATILERYTGFVAMIALGLIFMWFVEVANIKIKMAVILVAIFLVVVTWLSLNRKMLARLGRIKKLETVIKHLSKIQEAFHLARANRQLLIKALLLSLVFHTLTVVNTAVAAYAVGWYDPPIYDLFVVLPLILLIGAIPLSPNGLGIQEGAFYFFLTGVGASPGQALAVAVVLRAKAYLLALMGGIVWFFVRGDKQQGQH